MRASLTPLVLALALAVGVRPDAQRLLARTYSERDGLPSSRVHDVRQSPAGTLWFSTRLGLCEYDGTRWRPIAGADGEAVRDVQRIHFDHAGRAWLLKADGRVLHGAPGSFEALPPSPGEVEGQDRWIDGVVGDGPDGVEVALASARRGLRLWRGERWTELDASSGLEGEVRALGHAFGRLFVGTDRRLLVRIGDVLVPAFQGRYLLPAGPISALATERVDEGERLWVLGPSWLGYVADGAYHPVATDLPEILVHFWQAPSFAPDGLGGAFYGNRWVLYHVDGSDGSVRRLGKPNGLATDGVNALHRDREGLLWGATDLGAFKLVGLEVETWSRADGLLEDEVSAIAQLPDGRLALGHNGGLTLQGQGRRDVYRFGEEAEFPTWGRVLDLEVSATGELWIAAAGQGVGVLASGGDVAWLPVPDRAKAWANAVHADRDSGRVWVGTPVGLFRAEEGELWSVAERELGELFVRRIEVASDGTVYLASPAGLWEGRDDRWRSFPSGPTATHDFYAVLERRDGTVWCGASDGLWVVRGGRLVRPELFDGPSRPVYSLVEDGQDRLWFGTDYGVFRHDGRRLAHYTSRNGLAGQETNRAAALVSAEGEVWFGTTEGLTVFRPRFEREPTPPRAELYGIHVGGRSLAADGPLALGRDVRDLAVRVRALSFVDEGALEFHTRLLGLAEDWRVTEAATVHVERYGAVPPGRYKFQARARLPGGELGPLVESGTLTVRGPWWTSWWAYLLLGAGVVGLSLFVQHEVTRHRHARHLEERMAVRTRELEASLAELSKSERLRSLGVLAGGIAHDFNNVLTVLTGRLSLLREELRDDGPLLEHLEHADQALQRAAQLSTQLRTFATGGEPITEAVDLARLIDECAHFVLSGSKVAVEIDAPAGLPPAEIDPAQIHQVLENLLINARQAMPAGGTVRVSVRGVRLGDDDVPELAAGDYVRVVLSDEGAGISADHLQRVFDPFFTTRSGGSGLGLATAASIARRHRGQLSVTSSEGAGAVFTLLVPVSGAQVADEALPERDVPRGTGRVLVVDDQPGVRRVAVRMLESLGYEAAAVDGCEAAVRAIDTARRAERPFQTALVDLTMPGGPDGPTTLARLRELEPGLRAIAMSGYSADRVLARSEDFGFDASLHKPFRLRELGRVLGKVSAGEPGAAPSDGGARQGRGLPDPTPAR